MRHANYISLSSLFPPFLLLLYNSIFFTNPVPLLVERFPSIVGLYLYACYKYDFITLSQL